MKRRRFTQRARKRTDWVYRPNGRGVSTAPLTGTDTLGTYEYQVRSLTTGYATAQVLWLVDAADRRLSLQSQSPTTFSVQSSSAQPEGRRTRVRFVEGHIYFEPSTWAVGNLMAQGIRIMATEQDIVTGQAVVDSDMTMWLNGGAGNLNANAAAHFANDKALCMYEQRMYKGFAANDASIMVMRVRARLNWALQPHHGLALWMEGETTGVNVRYQTWLRTLVEVP